MRLHLIFALLLGACAVAPSADDGGGTGANTDGPTDPTAAPLCTGTFTLTLPDDTQVVLDACQDVAAAATFAFNDETVPTVRSFSAAWYTLDDGTDCSVQVTQGGICGAGFYDTIAPGGGVSVHTYGCQGLTGEPPGVYDVANGYVEISTISAGDTPGLSEGEDVSTVVRGRVDGTLVNGWQLRGEFGFSLDLPGVAARPAACLSVLSDEDGDGYDAATYGGSDCDDGDPDVHPNGTDVAGDGVDQDCDGQDATLPASADFQPVGFYLEWWSGWFGGTTPEAFSYAGDTIFPYVAITLGDQDFFDGNGGETCDWIGLMDPIGPHDLGRPDLWEGWEVQLIEWDTTCEGMDPALWGGTTPREAIEGRRWAIGYAPLSSELESRLASSLGSSWGVYDGYVFGAWVAVEDRDDGSLVGFESNYGLTYATTPSGEIAVDANGNLTLRPPMGGLPEGAVSASPYYAAATEGAFYD